MAPPPGTLRVGRYFTALIVLLGVLYAVVAFPGQRHTPKLGIDLVGGVRVIFTAISPKGSPPPTSSQMSQARQILEDRINGTGVTGSTVVVQGGDQLVVEIPSGTGTDVAKLGKAAVLNFRGVVAPAQAVSCGVPVAPSTGTSTSPSTTASGTTAPPSSKPSTSAKASATGSAAANAAQQRQLAAPSTTAKSTAAPSTAAPSSAAKSGSATTSGTAKASGSASSSATVQKCFADPIAEVIKIDPSLKNKIPNAEQCPSPGIANNLCKPYTALSSTQQQEIAAALRNYDCNAAQTEADLANNYYLACDVSSGTKIAYLLGHVVVAGRQIDSASAQAPNTSGQGGSADWTVALTLGSSGADRWSAWTSKYNTTQTGVTAVQTSTTAPCGTQAAVPCSDFVGFTLDGQVISAPVTQAALSRQTQISGGFNQTSANDLAKQLNYGKLPLSFRADANQHVSATLGSSQLKAAFLAGGIGLILVVIYSLLYYRGLGLVTIASLLVSGTLTYAMLVILATQIGFTLDLSGIAGFIVALGITADSFVVFFERIKDEVHEGRSLRVAIPRAWVRARRTVLSADTVSFLAAAILYYFAAADVKGFAFTLGLSTILDLVVVFLFTHPIVSLLSRSRAFGNPRFTGLNSVRVGGIAPSEDDAPRTRRAGASRTAAKRKAAPVAVLEREDGPESLTAEDEDEAQPAVDAENAAAPDLDDPDDNQRPRRRTTPEAGSAAERAAARRARLRGKTDEEGTS
ncbi:MAG: preprotein translocase subunit SecD [Pseudonocardiales bacterium]|nr:preprotein translocase subunit SecD [Pseudonocardiales bacterium]